MLKTLKNDSAALPGTHEISLAGSIRRRKETIGDVDIIATSEEPEKIISEFCVQPDIDRILGKGPTKCSIVLSSGVQVYAEGGNRRRGTWTALVHFTGFENPQHSFAAPGASTELEAEPIRDHQPG